MRVITFFLFVVLLIPSTILPQKKGSNKELGKALLGTYEGYQESYPMRDQYGNVQYVGGQKLMVDACDYKFEIAKNNKVTMYQLPAGKSKPYVYKGSYKIIEDKSNYVEILCKVSLDKYTNPEYTIVIDKKTKTATCEGTNEPEFTMKKTK
ncbi:MAG: hypothetical protein LC102_01635 [Ignavibacteriales bacterium]|nr:MAG: hypothetical protein F9K26_04615 [Ignavibacteriaceae bacterium]MBW7873424.1 hypothetical protein [Ignavibacteria bacterium]MCZ2142115.1 hypothetical protein [Ignavibacteriales bacterium]OQY75691.1 MAG: hypothetical protein B6D45_05370 [Ignavibacteriales bacterium UTCHB3]MBV6444851.1 hypothetical protein [Ignavibacteriaceae bacterium]